MKFVIENISKSSGRLGQLVQRETEKKFKTPLLLQTTKSGSIPYLSREVFDYLTKNEQVLQISLVTMGHMAEGFSLYTGSLASYVGFKDYPTMLTIRDPCETMPSGMNDKDIVPLFTRQGKAQVTAEKYMDLVETFSPDIYQGLSDVDTNLESSKKRVQKSVDRTEKFMNYCYERHRNSTILKNAALFVPIIGGYNTFARSQSIRHSKSNPDFEFTGYLLEGFHNYGLNVTKIKSEKLIEVMKHCLSEMDVNKPIMMLGAYTPLIILELIKLGVDIFDSSYAYFAAKNFKALIFNFDLQSDSVTKSNSPFLDMTDEKFKEDFTPFISSCICLACQKHTRAYVHHLYKTKELLGPILLMIHNLHHYMAFFDSIRSSIAKDNLPELINLLKFQSIIKGEEQEVDYHIEEHKNVSK